MSVASTALCSMDGAIVLTDGAALSLAIQIEEGNLQITGLRHKQRAPIVGKHRGRNAWFREGEDQDFDVSFDATVVALLGDGTTAMLTDAFLRLGVWAAATSTLPSSTGDLYTLKLTFTGTRIAFGATANTTAVIKYLSGELSFAEAMNGGKLSFKGTGHVYSTDYLTLTG